MPKAQFITVTAAESGQKLLQFLERRLTGDVPRSAIQRWIRKGQVRVDKGRKKPFDRIDEGQMVRVPPYTPGEEKQVTTGELSVIHETDALMVIAKPAGLAAHGGDGVEDSVTARIRGKYSDTDFMPTLAHRLDKDTSGLLLAAKGYGTLRELNDKFAAGEVGKLYLAWVKGEWREESVVLLEDQLEKKGAPGSEKVKAGSGKTALAQVKGLISTPKFSLVAVRLLTGRTHQIRVQLASRKHPVVGDRKYGKAHDRGNMRLHCYAMKVNDKMYTLPPQWGGKWEVPPAKLQEALELLDDVQG